MSFLYTQSSQRNLLQLLCSSQRPVSVARRTLGGERRTRGNTASFRARKRQEKKKQQRETRNEDVSTVAESVTERVTAAGPPPLAAQIAPAAAEASSPSTSSASLLHFLQKYVLPVRYRYSKDDSGKSLFYTRQHALSAAQRFPLWLLLAALASFDETNPYSTIRITGPSMLPTCAPDGSEIYLKSAWHRTIWYKALQYIFPSLFQPSFRVGDLVGLCHPDHGHHVSCKRVAGVEGDKVQRYGHYVHLFEEQDPTGFGITWPSLKDKTHAWMDRDCAWDADMDTTTAGDPRRKLTVPKATIWVEGDCPGLAIDSRQYGPVPIDWIQGKLIGRLWPFWRKEGELPLRVRPHPIPLDDETLQRYNVHRIMPTAVRGAAEV